MTLSFKTEKDPKFVTNSNCGLSTLTFPLSNIREVDTIKYIYYDQYIRRYSDFQMFSMYNNVFPKKTSILNVLSYFLSFVLGYSSLLCYQYKVLVLKVVFCLISIVATL